MEAYRKKIQKIEDQVRTSFSMALSAFIFGNIMNQHFKYFQVLTFIT